jgi:hypothetical protein
MSFQAIDQLTNDITFNGRIRACSVQQAEIFRNDARLDFVAAANEVLRGDGLVVNALIRITAAGPNGAAADNGDGTINQSNVTDADILSSVQTNWQVAADLYYNEDGTPI